MSSYKDLVSGIARQVATEVAPLPNVQGYIPRGGIQKEIRTCTVRYPNPRQGMHAGQIEDADGGKGSYLESHGLALPRTAEGVIDSVLNIADSQDVAVLIGFQGGRDLGKPHIIQLLNLENNTPTTENRSSAATEQARTGASPSVPAPPPVPPPDAAPPANLPPSAAAKERALRTE